MKALRPFEAFQMFYKYTPIIGIDTAKNFAKISRARLIKQLGDHYKKLEDINTYTVSECDILASFLSDLRSGILSINGCQTTTSSLQKLIQERLRCLETHPKYEDIKSVLTAALLDIAIETKYAQERDLYITKNEIAKIKNNAVYTATLPSIAAIGGAIVSLLNPIGFIILGVSGVALIISQAIFWMNHRNAYTQLQNKITKANLAIDLAAGTALPDTDIPEVLQPKSENSSSPTSQIDTEEEKLYLFSVDIDQQLDQGVQIAVGVVSDVKELVSDVIYDTAAAIGNKTFGLLGRLNKMIEGDKPVRRTLHLHDS